MKTDSQDELGNGKKVVAEADLKHALKEALKDIRKFEKLLSFRLIFYSIVAASVLSTIPFTFKVGVSYLLFISIILFIAIIETFLRLDEGDYITNIT
ncbi:MAG: hypothetical protein OEV80_11810, partial [candidate division Zixibacteria bacterium]|nr:hypothetical protein [candidate division Zixibacteria bacterium]